MTVADSSLYRLIWAEESTFKTAPGGTYQAMRIVNDTLGRDTETIESDEIDVDRQTADHIRAAVQLGGEVPVEFSFGAHDEWLRYGLLSGAWAGFQANPGPNVQVDETGASAGQTDFVLASGTWASFVVNQIVYLEGADATGNNGFWKILANVGDTLSCEGTGVDQASTANITVVQCSQIVTGQTLNTMTLEGYYQNLAVADGTMRRTGAALSGFSLETAKRDKVRGSFTILGADEVGVATSDASGVTAVTTAPIYSVTGDLTTFAVNGDRTAKMTSFRINYNNGLYVIDPAGVLEPEGIGIGQVSGDGNFEYYYEDLSTYNLYDNYTNMNFLLGFANASGEAMGFEVLRGQPGSGRRNPGGKNQASIANLGYNMSKDGTELISMRIVRNSA